MSVVKQTKNQSAFTTTNKNDELENDTLYKYGNYISRWMLDTTASGNYADKKTRIPNQQEITYGGINMSCANNGIMKQQAEGELPFDKIPDGAKDVQIFEDMQKQLISGGKLVTNGVNIVFDVPNAHLITRKTKEAIRKIIRAAEAENEDDIIMTVPFDHNTLKWQINQAKSIQATVHMANNVIPVPEHVANNVHRIRSKQVLIDFLHRAAGYPMKKT